MNILRCFPRFALRRCIRKCSQFVGRRPQLLRREVRVTPHHLTRFPRTELLRFRHACTGHHVPRRPFVPQVVPAGIPDASVLERIPPGPRVGLPQWAALEREYTERMLFAPKSIPAYN